MTPDTLIRLRLARQRLAGTLFRKPEEVVRWFGAVQAQDYLGALWAIGQRTRRATEASVEAAEASRAIVRTWPMRGTLHFVAAADARWITQLLAPRIIQRNAARWKREYGIDAKVLQRSRDLLTRALAGGQRLPREALYAVLEAGKVRTSQSRGLHVLLCLALQGVLCLAGRIGKQHSFALLDEWLAPTAPMPRDAALAELARRYFTSHGPATVADFAWWSGLTIKDALQALDGVRGELDSDTVDDLTCYWGELPAARSRGAGPQVRLLPAYDEYTVAYKHRDVITDLPARRRLTGMALLSPVILVDGRVVGTWTRELTRGASRIEPRLLRPLSSDERTALDAAAAEFGRYLGLQASIRLRSR